MSIGVAAAEGHEIPFLSALRFSLLQARSVVALTIRLTARCLLLAAPFLAGLAAVYFYFLGDYDINYYLTEKPPEFLRRSPWLACCAVGSAAGLVPRLIGWGLALPLVLFEGVRRVEALAESRAGGGPASGLRNGARPLGCRGVSACHSCLQP